MNECVICNAPIDALGCPECGKFLWKDNAWLIVNKQAIQTRIFVTQKKFMINGIDQTEVKPSFGQAAGRAVANQFGILGMLFGSKMDKMYDRECIVEFKNVKNFCFPYQTAVSNNCILIEEKKRKYVLVIEDENNRQKLINLLSRS